MTKEDQQTTTAAATSTRTDPMLQQIHNIIYREIQIHCHFPINVDIAELWIPKKQMAVFKTMLVEPSGGSSDNFLIKDISK